MDNVMRNRPILALLRDKGRISYGIGGKDLDWRVKSRRAALTPYGDGQLLNFGRVNRHRVATLPWKSYVMGESITKMEKLANKGEEAILKIVESVVDSMMSDFKDGFEDELFKDDSVGGDELRLTGFKSALAYTGTAQYTAASDTYASLSTVLGNYGGAAISGTWPAGTFDAEYDFWTPLIVNYTHADWVAAATWAAAADEVLRTGITLGSKNDSLEGQLDLVEMDLTMYKDFKILQAAKEQINVMRNQPTGLTAMGFRDVINFDGIDCHGSYSVPAGEAYGLNLDTIELCSMQDDFIVPGEDTDITHLSDQFTLDYYGNMKLNPREMIFWKDVT
jgi:hypothetical protein